ncbi:DoxX family membrane protein [Streptomyces sp. Z26]|nr:DoxX family membrane protein [Streptomyces sp. Z26]
MLAAIFISGGVNALRNSQEHAKSAGPFLDKALGDRAEQLPDSVPTDAETLVKVDAAVKIGAGTLFALGRCPRLSAALLLGSLVPTTAAAHAFWEHEDEEARQQHLIHFLKNAGLAGGLLLAVADTEGKPSLGWRTRHAAHSAGKHVQTTQQRVQKNAQKKGKQVRKQGKRVGDEVSRYRP